MSQQTAGVAWPVSDGTRVPYEIYTSQDVFDREQERIFRGPLWNYVALEGRSRRQATSKRHSWAIRR